MDAEEVAKLWEANAENWTRLVRAGYDVYRDKHNTPAFLAMLPQVAGLCGLDIGCGEGENTRKLARLGAQMHAIDIAPTFVRHALEAERAEPLEIIYRVADGQSLPFPDGTFDFVTAFMSLMDMPDPGGAVREVARVLRLGGFLQFSIIHPCFSPPHRRPLRDAQGNDYAVEVGRYFDCIDGMLNRWLFSNVPAEERARTEPFRTPLFHHTLSSWVDMICDAGLTIEKFGEPCATLEEAAVEPVIADTRVAPLFLHIRARKPAR